MRISSFILTARDYSKEITVMDYNSNDNTETYVKKLGCSYLKSSKNKWYSNISKDNLNDGLVIINLDKDMTLSKLKQILEQDLKDLSEIHVVLKNNNKSEKMLLNNQKIIKNIKDFDNNSWIFFNKNGFEQFLSQDSLSNFNKIVCQIDSETNQKSIIVKKSINPKNKRNKNPLIIFGIPGLIMIISSFILVFNVLGKYDSIDSVSLGTAVITIGTTVLGILSLMSAIISYILGKQTEFILTNYSD